MARICPKCGGSGIDATTDKPCMRCPDGKLLRAQEDAKARAKEAKKKEGPPVPKAKTSPALNVAVGDWVRIHDCIGIVWDVDGTSIYFNGVRWAVSGKPATAQKGWVSGLNISPLPLEPQDKKDAARVIKAMEHLARHKQRALEIDAALDKRDFDRLRELTQGEGQEH